MRVVVEQLQPPRVGDLLYCVERSATHYPFNWHMHREFELTLIVEGQGSRFVGDSIEDYTSGDLVLLGPDLPHTYVAPIRTDGGQHRAVVIQFSDRVFAGQGPEAIGEGPVRALLERAAFGLSFVGPIASQVSSRLMTLPKAGPVRQLGELLLALDTLATGSEMRAISNHGFARQPVTRKDHPIDPVCRFVNDRYRDHISLEEAARVAGMSVSAFCRFFKRTTGRTFTRYVNELRIGHACRLLIETNRGVADIAHASGFSNLSHFNERFLEHRHMRPSKFRRAHQATRAVG